MEAAELSRVKAIFAEAVEKPAVGREAFLNRACVGNPSLRAEVEGFLAAAERAGDFLSAPTTDQGLPQAAHERLGSKIGPYKLLQLIGEGGFGSVFMAEQEFPVRRKVALKIIKLGMDTKQVIARFEAERQALAMMDHPNIARVLEAGATESGRPYFVMELVKGIPITEYCDQAKLDTEQRLSLFMDVCSAVQHAHQKGVIHRDLKPSNVMITLRDDKPVVKVIDFGIAKATEQKLTEKTLFTAYGQMIGTPAYMSPEQAVMSELDVDTRSDVYSLGVLLYELLIGSPPFDAQTLRKAGFDEMRRIIREQQPQKPSTRLSTLAEETKLTVAGQRDATPQALSRQLHGELDWIVLKAIEKDRTRRYESASAFAQDIQRHLNAEPVTAGAPSPGYRLRKFLQRNRGAMTVAAAIALLLLAGTAVSTWQAVRATRAKGEAIAAVIAKGKALDSANAANEQSQKRLGQIEKANDILGSIFENLDPREIAKADRPLQAVLVEKLDNAAQQLQGDAIGDPLVVAGMQYKLGRSLVSLGEPKKAIVLFERALATYTAKPVPDHTDTLNTMGELARAYLAVGKLDLGLPLAEETLKRRKAELGPDHHDTLVSMDVLADAYQAAGKLDLALPLYQETLKRFEAKLGPDHPETLVSMGNLGQAYQHAGKMDLALPLLAKTLNREEAKLGPDHPETLASMNNLASGYQAAGKLDLALPLFERTMKRYEQKLGPDHLNTLTSMNNLASGYQAAGKLDLALPLFERTMKRYEQKLGPDHPNTLTGMNNLASAYLAAGKLDLALPLFEETLKRQEARLGPDHPDKLRIMNDVASAYLAAGKLDLALPLFEETLRLTKAKFGPDHPLTLTSMNSLASAYQAAGKLDLALPLAEETLRLSKAKLGPDHPGTLTSMNNLVSEYHAAGKLDLALPLAEETLRLRRSKLGPDHPDTLVSMANLASAYKAAGKLDLALPLYEETLKLAKARLGPDHPGTLHIMNDLGSAYWSAKRLDKSIPLFEETLKRYEATLGRRHPDALMTVGNLGVNYKDAGRLEEGVSLIEAAYRYEKRHHKWGYSLLDAYVRMGKTEQAVAVGNDLMAESRATLPSGSLDLAGELGSVGLVLLDAEAFTEAEPPLRDCLAILRSKQPNRWTTFNAQSLLGDALLGARNYDDAEPLLLQGYEGLRQLEWTMPAAERIHLTESLQRLVNLYETRGSDGDPETAAKYRELLRQRILRSGPEHPDITFWFDYNFNPNPGPRQWKQVDDTQWREIYPDGHFDAFFIVGPSNDESNPGVVVRRQPDTGSEALIPPIEEGAPFKYRRKSTDAWRTLGIVQLPSMAAPPMTRPAATSAATRSVAGN